jgi:hypothetical protein
MTTQSLLARIPENTSFLQGNKFTFEFPTLPFLRYFCQTGNLPGVQTNAVTVETPFSATYRHGDKLIYDTLEIIAIVDEDLKIWEESYGWLKALTFPNEFREYWKNTNGKYTAYHDGILTINTNANEPNIRIKFLNCHPVSISGINFDTKLTADATITCTISFRYDTFSIDRI